MYDVNNVVQRILYSPSLTDAHHEQRIEEVKDRFQDNLAGILLNTAGG